MPNFNHARYLSQSLGAIFAQSVLPKEVIVIDDASTDESLAVVEKYQKSHSQIVLIKSKVNQGPVKALNIGLKSATGKYLAFCSADDQVLPGFFEEGSKYLEEYPEAGICSSNPSFFKELEFSGESHLQMTEHRICSYKTPAFIQAEAMEKLFLFGGLWIPSHASLFRKDFVMECGGFDEKLHHLADWFLNIKIALRHGIVYVPTSFGAFRVSNQSYGAIWNRSYKKKVEIYSRLTALLLGESKLFRKRFCKSGSLGQVSSDCLIYLFFHISLWKYLPYAFFRKTANLFRKIKRQLEKKKYDFHIPKQRAQKSA